MTENATLFLIPADAFHRQIKNNSTIAAWFGQGPTKATGESGYTAGLMALQVSDLMAGVPITCASDTSVTDVARLRRDKVISSVLVMDADDLRGIVTVHDLTNKVLAEGKSGDMPVAQVMTPDPKVIAPPCRWLGRADDAV